MPKKKDIVKGGAPIARMRENSRLMRTHESVVDFINGRRSAGSILDVFTSGLLGLDFLRTFEGELEDDIVYSDDDYDADEDEDDRHVYAHTAAYKHLEPHPRIKQLTDEEADKHAKELIEEEERRKDKTEKNKRKKLRKKEKKRLEKKNAVKDILAEEEQGKSDSSENPAENLVIESNAEANDSPESGQTQNGTEAAGCDEKSANNKEEEDLAEINKTEDGEQKDLDLDNSYSSTTKLVANEPCNERPAREKKKKKSKLLEIAQSNEEMQKVVEKPEVHKKKEEKHEPNKEKILDPTAEELAKRSRELAGLGNRLAASGQYEAAVKCFTDAIKYNPKEFKLFGNRSLCYERMQQYENALRDADLALSMEPNWIKGLFRKGKALCGLKRYYEASLIYKEVLELESSSAEAMQELKRAQTLHLMEMGFTWGQSSEALKTHATLEQAVEALFGDESNAGPGDAGASWDKTDQPVVLEENYDEGEWEFVLQTNRPRMQQVKDSDSFVQRRSKSQSPTPHSKNSAKQDIFSIWVGSLAPAVTYSTLHELFSRAGTVCSIKMLLEHQCAFVNYTRKEDCDRAIQCINGMVVEGAPLAVRYPNKFFTGLGLPKSAASDPFTRLSPYKKECFFWRTTGCTRQDCTFRHVPEHRNIDKDKFTRKLGSTNM
ncbi:RNA polymerase II-associated protein 3-like [Cebidichthys violaceus]|uniref:RNA polymerase II-associated protein 3-like n=1 Tax=Cebidichthys violaceus TaxID=271503 RepID=UPI0035CB9215